MVKCDLRGLKHQLGQIIPWYTKSLEAQFADNHQDKAPEPLSTNSNEGGKKATQNQDYLGSLRNSKVGKRACLENC